VAPYVVMLLDALKPAAELRASPPRFLPRVWRPENFLDVMSDPAFRAAVRISVTVALASTVLAVAAAIPAAYHTARRRFRGRSAFLFLVLVTQMFSPTTLVVGLYREFFELGLVNTSAALILTNAAFNLASSRRRPRSTAAVAWARSCASCCPSPGRPSSPRPSSPSSRRGTSTSWP
jgi:multiple sugar transport system permease protein